MTYLKKKIGQTRESSIFKHLIGSENIKYSTSLDLEDKYGSTNIILWLIISAKWFYEDSKGKYTKQISINTKDGQNDKESIFYISQNYLICASLEATKVTTNRRLLQRSGS